MTGLNPTKDSDSFFNSRQSVVQAICEIHRFFLEVTGISGGMSHSSPGGIGMLLLNEDSPCAT